MVAPKKGETSVSVQQDELTELVVIVYSDGSYQKDQHGGADQTASQQILKCFAGWSPRLRSAADKHPQQPTKQKGDKQEENLAQ